jgi:hypothetical protein
MRRLAIAAMKSLESIFPRAATTKMHSIKRNPMLDSKARTEILCDGRELTVVRCVLLVRVVLAVRRHIEQATHAQAQLYVLVVSRITSLLTKSCLPPFTETRVLSESVGLHKAHHT